MKPILAVNYNVHIDKKGWTALTTFLENASYDSYFILCDSNTLVHCLPHLSLACPVLQSASIIEIEPGEASKDIRVVEHIWQTLTDNGATRKSLLINLGGGVVSDIGGFVASTFKRGIDFINLPTTLLAMADASIGGKNGINAAGIKNHIGTITQPKIVFVHLPFLKTLNKRELRSGLAEIIKVALIADRLLFLQLRKLKPQAIYTNELIIERAIVLKARIVKKDPLEEGPRKLLNFGHSMAHALESVFMNHETPLLHGEAVGIGLMLESYLSYIKKRINIKELESILAYLKPLYHAPILTDTDWESFVNYLQHDKKNGIAKLNFVLLTHIGKATYDVAIAPLQIKDAISFYRQNLINEVS